jgi:phosphohistidine phosphatase SixA
LILLLIRHGQAAKREGESHLRLTARGQRDAALAGEAIKARQVPLTSLWHSPKPRAAETAKIILEKIDGPKINREEKKELSPEGDPGKIYEDLMAEKPQGLAIVSHLPFLEKLAYQIQAQMDHPPMLEFPTAGIQAFRWNDQWEHLWEINSQQNH